MRQSARLVEHRGRVGAAIAGDNFLDRRQYPVGRGDQRGAIGGDETAVERPPGLHQLGGQ